MNFLTNDKLVIVGAGGMIGSNMVQSALMLGLTPNICLYDIFSTSESLLWVNSLSYVNTWECALLNLIEYTVNTWLEDVVETNIGVRPSIKAL